jgi:predicted alpha/beta-hydrolase family hydrolase
VGLATNPEGVVAMYARYLQEFLFGRLFGGRGGRVVADEPLADVDVDEVLHPPVNAPVNVPAEARP